MSPVWRGILRWRAETPARAWAEAHEIRLTSWWRVCCVPRSTRRRNDCEIEVPAFGFGQTTAPRYTDMLVRPLGLGWHAKRADVTAGFQFYVPTATYQFRGSDNNGKGVWTYGSFVGTTLYFDEKKTVRLATTAYSDAVS